MILFAIYEHLLAKIKQYKLIYLLVNHITLVNIIRSHIVIATHPRYIFLCMEVQVLYLFVLPNRFLYQVKKMFQNKRFKNDSVLYPEF